MTESDRIQAWLDRQEREFTQGLSDQEEYELDRDDYEPPIPKKRPQVKFGAPWPTPKPV